MEYANLQSPAADPLSLEEADSSVLVQKVLFGDLLSMFEDFIKVARKEGRLKKMKQPQKKQKESPSGGTNFLFKDITKKVMAPLSVLRRRVTKKSISTEDVELQDQAEASRGTDDLQETLGESSPFLSPPSTSSDQIQLGKPQIVEKLPEESTTTEARTSPDGIPTDEGKVDYDDRFKLILETFHNIGEIMLFEESELVVTDPRQFTQELVKNIMDHDILNKQHPGKSHEIENILYKGIFNKNSFEGEDANKYWTLLKATGLGVELTPLAMFIPLLIMEQTSEEIESAAVQFRARLEQSSYKFACRYDVLNIAGNGIEFFHELTKVISFFT